ncbi:MAG TPA: HEAT repeat domain-containing protein [Anaerolineales bacterium]|nr:HEAT repeat domain-containing protein [Anaerolineales bacterium]
MTPVIALVIGYVLGILSVFLYGRARPLLQQIRENAAARREEAQIRRTSGLENNHRRLTLRRAQGMHLASPLFALKDILQEPRLIAPPVQIKPGVTSIQEDIISQTLPYMPEWPELAAIYRAPTLDLVEAITGGANVVIVGAAGAGKTVALAHLASLAANLQVQLEAGKDAVPFHYHIADLQFPFDSSKDPLTVLINAVGERAPVFDLRKIPDFIRQSIKSGTALLLIDGFDEVDPQTQDAVTEWFQALTEAYPRARIVSTGTANQLNGLVDLGFHPLALMAWGEHRISRFIQNWSDAWSQTVADEVNDDAPESLDPIIINQWLSMDNTGLTPFELTLKVWGAYAGDSLGSHVMDFIATHLRRVAPSGTPVAALELLAMQVVMTAQPIFDPRNARSWVKQYEVVDDEKIESGEVKSEPVDITDSQKIRIRKSQAGNAKASYGLLSKMVESGLLVSHPNDKMRFVHSVFNGYLAGQAVGDNESDTTLLAQPDWNGKALALRYLAARADASAVADILLQESDLPLHTSTFIVARWLRDAPKKAGWRAKAFASLLNILQAEGQPIALRAQAMAAFVSSGDSGVMTLFRQLLTSRSFEVIPLAALGSGALRDRKAVQLLEEVLQAPMGAVRRAACLALVAIGMDQAFEAVARALLQGDDELRRAAAQALANNPKDGHETLREGSTLADIMVRRAVVHGLARVEEPWAMELLQTMQVEDDQWAVRNLANQYVEEVTNRDPRAPKELTTPSETPWLIEFAGKQGTGIPKGGPATDVLTTAYKYGDTEERLAAIPYLKRNANEGIVGTLYSGMYGEDPEVREASFLALQEIAANGMELPHPNQFGLG